MVVLTILFVALMMFAVNSWFLLDYSTKAKIVATESAKVVLADKYWLGCRRPDYDPRQSQAQAEAVAHRLCDMLSIPAPQSVVLDDSEDTNAGYVSCVVTIGGMRMPYGGVFFPQIMRVSEKGVSTQSLVHPYAMLNIEAPGVNQNGSPSGLQGVQLPAIGFYKGINGNAGNPLLGTGNALPPGYGAAGGRLCQPVLSNKTMWVGGLYVAHPGDSPTFYNKLHAYSLNGSIPDAVSVQ